jgi:ribonucleoside-triphosphate reductase
MSRVVGYFSRINNWNKSKQAEFKSRQKGIYDVAPCECETTE